MFGSWSIDEHYFAMQCWNQLRKKIEVSLKPLDPPQRSTTMSQKSGRNQYGSSWKIQIGVNISKCFRSWERNKNKLFVNTACTNTYPSAHAMMGSTQGVGPVILEDFFLLHRKFQDNHEKYPGQYLPSTSWVQATTGSGDGFTPSGWLATVLICK